MKNGLYHIKNDKIYKMSVELDKPEKEIGTVASEEEIMSITEEEIGTVVSDKAIMSIIDTVTEYMYCNYVDCCMKDGITWDELQKVRNEIKSNAMEMIKTNLNFKLTHLSNMKAVNKNFERDNFR